MLIFVEATKAESRAILAHIAKNTGAYALGRKAAMDSVILVTIVDGGIEIRSNYYNSASEIASSERLPKKYTERIKNA